MFVKQHRLPYQALERMFNGEITTEDLAEVAQVNSGTIWNWKKHGTLTPLPQQIHDTCGCPCHAYRMGKLTSADNNWKKKKTKGKR